MFIQHTYVDQSPLVARRLGFASLPLAVLATIMASQAFSLMIMDDSATATSANLIHYLEWAALGALFWLW